MRALIEEHAAAFAGPRGAPTAEFIVRLGAEPIRDDPVDAADRAEFAVVDEFAHLSVIGIGALIEHGGEDLFRILVRGDEAFAVGFLDGNRFLHEHMQAVLQGIDADGGVIVVRRGDEHGIDSARTDQLVAAGEAFGLGEAGEFLRGGSHTAVSSQRLTSPDDILSACPEPMLPRPMIPSRTDFIVLAFPPLFHPMPPAARQACFGRGCSLLPLTS